MNEIGSVREAKDYLSGRIADEAKSQGIPLSEIERKMLYFSETDWTLPGMLEINAEFEREYDNDEYEKKIAGLIRNIEARDHDNPESMALWDAAVDKLAEGDNYLSIMLDPSFEPEGATARPPHDRLKLWLMAFAVVFGGLGLKAMLDRLQGTKLGEWLSHRNNLRAVEFGLIGLAALIYWGWSAKIPATINRFLNGRKTGSRA